MNSVKTGYLSKRPPLSSKSRGLSPQGTNSQTILPDTFKSLTPVKIIHHSPCMIGKVKSIIKTKKSKESLKSCNEDTKDTKDINNFTLRLKIEPKNSPVRVGTRRPHSIKPLKVEVGYSKSRVNSPVNDKYMLKVEEDAIKRPYNCEISRKSEIKEISCSEKIKYWRKKGLEQYHIAKNTYSAKHTPAVSPKRGTKKRIISELREDEEFIILTPKVSGKKFKFIKNVNSKQDKYSMASKRFSVESCGGMFIKNMTSTPSSFCSTQNIIHSEKN